MTAAPERDLPDLLDPAVHTDPLGWFTRVRERGPVVESRAPDGTPLLLVTRDADVRFVLSDPRFVTSATAVDGAPDPRAALMEEMGIPPEAIPYMNQSILDAAGADHTRLRKLVSRAFTVRRVAELRPRVQQITDALLDRLAAEDGVVDLVPGFCYPLPITVISELVGVPEGERDQWREWATAMFARDLDTIGPAVTAMVAHCHELVERRRAEPADDLVTGLVHAQEADGDRLSDVEMVTMILTLVIAGHETTSSLLGRAVPALLAAPDQLERLRRAPEGWPDAVAELMRIESPILVTRARYATEDVEIAGTTVRRGELVQPLLLSANTDPAVHVDPAAFDVARHHDGPGEGHVGFGFGVHYCLGAALARQEIEVALSTLFTRFPNLVIEGEPEPFSGLGFRRFTTMPVRLR
jgi:cytochrome P450